MKAFYGIVLNSNTGRIGLRITIDENPIHERKISNDD